jgi:Arc-like DNA binding domain
MHERISKEAASNHRSMNAEIVYRLQATMAPDETSNPAEDELSDGAETVSKSTCARGGPRPKRLRCSRRSSCRCHEDDEQDCELAQMEAEYQEMMKSASEAGDRSEARAISV